MFSAVFLFLVWPLFWIADGLLDVAGNLAIENKTNAWTAAKPEVGAALLFIALGIICCVFAVEVAP